MDGYKARLRAVHRKLTMLSTTSLFPYRKLRKGQERSSNVRATKLDYKFWVLS